VRVGLKRTAAQALAAGARILTRKEDVAGLMDFLRADVGDPGSASRRPHEVRTSSHDRHFHR
jgi:hypothetical protein